MGGLIAKRIAVLGVLLEAHPGAPVTRRQDFENVVVARGDRLRDLVRQFAFAEAFAGAPCEIVPIMVAAAESGGPFLHADYLEMVGEIEERLRDAGRLDGVFIFGHGAGQTTELVDMDGDYFARVRAIVGAGVPIVAELDLHAILSARMVEATDALVAYRTNPHLDQAERAQDCARILERLVHGEKTAVAYERVPLLTAQIAQIVKDGSAYSDLIDRAQRHAADPALACVSLLSGFSLGDSPDTGFSVCVTSWGDAELARRTCTDMAQSAWDERDRFLVSATSIPDAVSIERQCQTEGASALRVYADIADNPGGGGRGNTIHLLKAMAESGLDGILAGVFYDPALAALAWEKGVGAEFEATFNSQERERTSGRWTAPVRVESVFDRPFTAASGIEAGHEIRLGRSCVLSLGEGRVQVVVSSLRRQVTSPDYFHVGGLEVRDAKAVIVKSRGHFRAAFEPLTEEGMIFEVDGPGLTTATLSSMEWKRIQRPIFPLDREIQYTPAPKLKP